LSLSLRLAQTTNDMLFGFLYSVSSALGFVQRPTWIMSQNKTGGELDGMGTMGKGFYILIFEISGGPHTSAYFLFGLHYATQLYYPWEFYTFDNKRIAYFMSLNFTCHSPVIILYFTRRPRG
jgi:hypothetical protein